MAAKTPSLSEQAVEAIMDMIAVERRFRPGDKLPNELDLSEELGVSRITLREAIRVLCTRGILEIQRGKGTFVLRSAPLSKEVRGLDFSASTVRDLLELRLAVEPAAAYFAAKRAGEEEVQTIGGYLLKMEDLASRGQPCLREARELLCAIAAASHNPLFREVAAQTAPKAFQDHLPATALRDWREIVHCIQTGNGEGARALTRMHLLRLVQAAGLEIE